MTDIPTDRERINRLILDLNLKQSNLFLDGPADFLVKVVCEELLVDPLWRSFFGENIDPYKRMDYSIRSLPAMRLYNNMWDRQFESWFITGDLTADIIWPASIRRNELQMLPSVIGSAMLQQFRRTPFFNAIRAKVPGLNELGKSFGVDMSLGFEWGEEIVPLTQLRINFRIDLRQWDEYLENQNRTVDDPFEATLASLKKIVNVVQALRDDGVEEPGLNIETDVSTDP